MIGLAFAKNKKDLEAFLADIQKRYTTGAIEEDKKLAYTWNKKIFIQSPLKFKEKKSLQNTDPNTLFFTSDKEEVSFFLKGTPFELSIWRELLKIPSGKTSTYSEIAQKIENPKAVRAVGSAIGRNPISYLVPCHRVVGKNGKLTGYRWGMDVKEKLLCS